MRFATSGVSALLALAVLFPPLSSAQSLPLSARVYLDHHAALQRLVGSRSAAEIGLLDEKLIYMRQDGDWLPFGRTRYIYDDVHRIEEIIEAWGEGHWVPNLRVRVDGAGTLETVTTSESRDGNDYVTAERIERTYLHSQQTGETVLSSELIQSLEGEVLVDFERTNFIIDASFTITEAKTDRWNGNTWLEFERFTLAEENGAVVHVRQSWNGTSWVNEVRTSYPNSSIKELYHELVALDVLLSDYDGVLYGFHLLPDSEIQEWKDGAWIRVERQVLTRDAGTGRPLLTEFQEWSEDEWVTTERLTYTFDGESLATMSGEVLEEGESAWFTTIQEEYTWDDMFGLAQILQSSDEGDGLELVLRQDFSWRYTDTAAEEEIFPTGIALDAAYPNPFNPSTLLNFQIERGGHVSMKAFDVLGRQVAVLIDGVRTAGEHSVTFEAGPLPSGRYIVRLEAPGGHAVRTVTLLK
jgi:hypothetical protein